VTVSRHGHRGTVPAGRLRALGPGVTAGTVRDSDTAAVVPWLSVSRRRRAGGGSAAAAIAAGALAEARADIGGIPQWPTRDTTARLAMPRPLSLVSDICPRHATAGAERPAGYRAAQPEVPTAPSRWARLGHHHDDRVNLIDSMAPSLRPGPTEILRLCAQPGPGLPKFQVPPYRGPAAVQA
jgi:hypothetical protein